MTRETQTQCKFLATSFSGACDRGITDDGGLMLSEKRTYNGLPDLMTKVAAEEMNSMDDNISECKVVYMPQVLSLFQSFF